MEAIEEKQVNDRQIMEATVIERQDHSGRIRFKTKLPSGRDLHSEWIQESDKTKAGILWAEAVRGQIVLDSQESAALARRKLQEVRAVARSAGPVLLGPNGEPVTIPIGPTTPAVPPLASPSPASSTATANPVAYVQAQHAAARKRLDELTAERQRINFDYTEAQKAEAQWFGLLQAMSVGDSVLEQVSKGNAAGSSSSGSDGSMVRGTVTISTNPRDAIYIDDGSEGA